MSSQHKTSRPWDTEGPSQEPGRWQCHKALASPRCFHGKGRHPSDLAQSEETWVPIKALPLTGCVPLIRHITLLSLGVLVYKMKRLFSECFTGFVGGSVTSLVSQAPRWSLNYIIWSPQLYKYIYICVCVCVCVCVCMYVCVYIYIYIYVSGFCVHSASVYLLVGAFKLFTLKVIINRYVLISIFFFDLLFLIFSSLSLFSSLIIDD